MPNLMARILRAPDSDEHRQMMLHTAASGPEEAEPWSWEHSQRRLQRAYDEGGFTLWAQMALREMELEAGVEREKRERQFRKEREELT